MKKLSKIKLNKFGIDILREEMPVLDEFMQRRVIGGANETWYSYAVYESMLAAGYWAGGYVHGIGYIAGSVTVTGAGSTGAGNDFGGINFTCVYETLNALTGRTDGMLSYARYLENNGLVPAGSTGTAEALKGVYADNLEGYISSLYPSCNGGSAENWATNIENGYYSGMQGFGIINVNGNIHSIAITNSFIYPQNGRAGVDYYDSTTNSWGSGYITDLMYFVSI